MSDMDVSRAAFQLAQFRLNDPLLRYQLDPGEPGLLRDARASDSVAAVSAQERGNLNQFRREAFMAGRMVVYQSISFTPGVEGLFTTLHAGLTEVVSVPMPSPESPETIYKPPAADESSPTPVEAPTESSELTESIEAEQLQLLSRLSALQNRIDSARAMEANPASDPAGDYVEFKGIEFPSTNPAPVDEPDDNSADEAGNADEDNTIGVMPGAIEEVDFVGLGLKTEDDSQSLKIEFEPVDFRSRLRGEEEEIEQINRKLNELDIMRMQAGLAHLNEVMMGSIHQNIDLLTTLLAVANRVSPNSHFNDLSASVPVLGSAIDYTA